MRRASILVLTLLVAATGCGTSDEAAVTDTNQVVAGLCEAELHAGAGHVDAASAAFQDKAHAGLHELAAELQEENPTLAGELLEAKESVESALAGATSAQTPPDVIASRISSLLASVQASLAFLNRPAEGCA